MPNKSTSGHLDALIDGLKSAEMDRGGAVADRLPSKSSESEKPHTGQISAETLPMYASLAVAITRQKATAAGRVWAIVHNHFNRRGRQIVPESEIVDLICSADSPSRLFTARQWRNIRLLGMGVFWEVAGRKAGLVIHGAIQVAARLSVDRLEKGRVKLPLSLLTKSAKSAKSAFYAAFDTIHDESPISRAAKAQVTGLDRVSQWRHEKGSGLVSAETNLEIVTPIEDNQTVENTLYAFGQASFVFVDKKGKQGRAGQIYLARQMPNSYQSILAQSCDGRRKKINQRLKHHVIYTGHGERSESDFQRRYYSDGQEAKRAVGRKSERVSVKQAVDCQKADFWNSQCIL